MASRFASIPSALLIRIVRVTRLASLKSAEIPVSVLAVSILFVRLLITNQFVPVQLDSQAMHECNVQSQPSKVTYLYYIQNIFVIDTFSKYSFVIKIF